MNSLLVWLPVLVAACNSADSGVVLGGPCEAANDCASPGVCVYGVCVEDDFFQEGSLEGEPHGGGGTDIEFMSDCYQLPAVPYQLVGYHHGSPVGGGFYHAGDDVKGAAGTSIYSVYEGTVKSAGKVSSWGGLVEIEHTNPVDDSTFYSIYGHLRPSSILVSVGQKVAAGQELGVLGTQQENGGWIPHLHFSIYTGVYPAQGVLKGHLASLAGYQDPIPWLKDNCVSCKCEGALGEASISDDTLFVSGSLKCDGGIDKWSVAVHDKAVFGAFPEGVAVGFSEIVDLGAYGFADSDAPVGLWARPVGGEACLLDQRIVTPDGSGGQCVPEDHTICHDGDVHWADSCGTSGAIADECVAPKKCVQHTSTSATCQEAPVDCGDGMIDPGEDCDADELGGASCISEGYDSGVLVCSEVCSFDASGCCNDESSYQCHQGDVYWYDSCGVVGGLKEACADGCSDGTCVDACSDTFTVTKFKCSSFSTADGNGPGGGELFELCGTADAHTGFMTIRARKEPNSDPVFGDREYHVRVSDLNDPACGPASSHFVVSDASPKGKGSGELEFNFQSSWKPGQTTKAYCVTASTKPGDLDYDAADPQQKSWWWSEKVVVTRECL
ncbi:M23 family metallopeptidase [Nannocystis sp. RBIL2]|uniref:M23 family metallopeptidase n=1 Tax=Nannocystis sp. RBIL2 TaxID=2996788 RepID=UPI00226E55C9|nr:M23 family metallopeptidase [Nannocystis sp. RBIL2]MCY1064926.1 M23 family metallopeptidase [Nannocystis sp. RBIL2]